MKRAIGSIFGGFLGAALFFGALWGYDVARGDVNGGDNPSYPLAISLGGTGCSAPNMVGNPCFVDGQTAQLISGTKTFTQSIFAMNGIVMGPSYITTSSQYMLGDIQASSDSVNASRVAPVYWQDGTATAATMHAVFFQKTVNLAANCLTLTVCPLTANTVSLTSSAQFTSGLTAWCHASPDGSSAVPLITAALNAGTPGTTVTLGMFNSTASTVNSGNFTVAGVCVGF